MSRFALLLKNDLYCSSLFVLIRNWSPGFVRVEALHFRELIEGSWAEIIFVNNAVLADDECLHTGHIVFSRCGYQRETPDHHTFHYEIHFAERSSGSLSL